MTSVMERFWAKVQKTDSCWVWTASVDGNGYAKFVVRPKWWKASRFLWTTLHGEIPSGLVVMHTCDNPKCVRPEHLKLGTPKDNIQDMMNKKRNNCGRFPGESNPNSKLTNTESDQIREMYRSGRFKQTELAVMFGVTQAQISWITRN